jgi:uncharacterized protein (TIGR02594 family)
MNLPKAYRWLAQEPAPRHLLKAVELFGVTESVGTINNPVIMGWAKELKLEKVYTADSIPWCGLYAAVVMHRAARPVVDKPLWALNWNNFGVKVQAPMLGDILTFTRKSGGHVGFYVGEDSTAYHVLGGNQGDKVSVVRIAKKRLSQARRPQYNSQPTNIRKVVLASNGALSTDES